MVPLPDVPIENMQHRVDLLGRSLDMRQRFRERAFSQIPLGSDLVVEDRDEIDEGLHSSMTDLMAAGYMPVLGVIEAVSPILDGSGYVLLVADQSYSKPLQIRVDYATAYRIGRCYGVLSPEVPPEDHPGVSRLLASDLPGEQWVFHCFLGRVEDPWAVFAEPA